MEEVRRPTPTQELVSLPTDDQSYANWISQHQRGYVINAHKTHNVPMLWHRADCGHIQPDGVLHWVSGSYLKACSLNAGALVEWAKTRPEALEHCQTCRDKWVGEQ